MPDNTFLSITVPTYCPKRDGHPHEFSHRGAVGLRKEAGKPATIAQVYFCKWCLHVERRTEPEWPEAEGDD